jgi:BON domain
MDNDDGAGQPNDPENQYYIEEVTPESEEGWTSDSIEATEEAEPYMPPTDPPGLGSSNQGEDIATGFGISPEDAPYRSDAPRGDAWIQEEVQRVLREDSITSKLPVKVRVVDGVVYIHGYVGDAEDAEQVESVASEVPGVTSVEDRTVVDPDRVDHTPLDFVSPEAEP